jgi:hypothetical protein
MAPKPKTSTIGRPALFHGPRQRTINMTDEAYEKAEADAEVITARAGFRVSISQAIEAAVRGFDAGKFKP